MRSRYPEVTALVEKIRQEAALYGVTVKITKSKHVYAKDGSAICCGVFIPPTDDYHGVGRIRVAAGGRPLSEVILSLAHEFIHMRQYFNKEKIYFTPDYYKLEKNTESRAISFIKKNNIPRKLVLEAQKSSKNYLSDLKNGTIVVD